MWLKVNIKKPTILYKNDMNINYKKIERPLKKDIWY